MPVAEVGGSLSKSIRRFKMTTPNTPPIQYSHKTNVSTPKAQERRERNAFVVATIFLIAIFFNLVLSFGLGFQSGDWQLFVRGGVVLAYGVVAIISTKWIKQGQIERGIWVLLSGMLMSLSLTGALFSNTGGILIIIEVFMVIVVALQTLPTEKIGQAIVIGVVAAISTYLFDILAPSYRLPAPEPFVNSMIIIGGLVSLSLVWIGVHGFKDFTLRGKLTVALIGTTVITLIPVGGFFLSQVNSTLKSQAIYVKLQDVSTKTENTKLFLANVNSDVLFLSQSSALTNYLYMVNATNIDPTRIAVARSTLEMEFLSFAQNRSIYAQIRYLDLTGQEIVRVDRDLTSGTIIILKNNLQNKSARYYFQDSINLSLGQVYISALDLNIEDGETEEPHKPMLRYATPVIFNGKTQGIVILNVLAERFLAPLGSGTSSTFLVDSDGYYLYHPEQAKRWGRDLETGITVFQDFPELTLNLFSGEVDSLNTTEELFSYSPVILPNEELPRWYLVSFQPSAEVFAPVRKAMQTGILALSVALVFVVVFTFFVSRIISVPMIELTRTVEKLSTGDLHVRAKIHSDDEIGILAVAFNNMSTQLSGLIGSLEERVVERTKALKTSTKVSRHLSTILDQRELVLEVVKQVRDTFNYYHVHIYVLDEESGDFVIAGGTGKAGKAMLENKHKVHQGKGLVGLAAEKKHPILVSDVNADPSWLPNALLPETKSEIAVPILMGDRVLGVLDVQHNISGGLNQEDIDLLRSIANQVAVAIQNARYVEEIQRTSQRLKEVDRIKSEFLANMSHELRTPLNSVMGYAEVLLMGIDGELNEEQQEDIQSIYDNGKQLLALINDVLDLSKIEAGRMVLVMEDVSIGDMITEVQKNGIGIIHKHQKELEILTDISPDLPTITADTIRIRQVLNNLISNAIKFSNKGKIFIRAYSAEDHLTIEIEDEGIGINSEDLERIFDRFTQADGSASRRADGTGLGLPITYHLITMHQGSIEAESELGKGSVFTVHLPISQEKNRKD